MIITDVTGGKLKLLKRTLTEVTGERMLGTKWTVNLTSLKPSEDFDFVTVYRNRVQRDNVVGNFCNVPKIPTGKITGAVRYLPTRLTIGCRTFNKKTFAIILKAIKAVK